MQAKRVSVVPMLLRTRKGRCLRHTGSRPLERHGIQQEGGGALAPKRCGAPPRMPNNRQCLSSKRCPLTARPVVRQKVPQKTPQSPDWGVVPGNLHQKFQLFTLNLSRIFAEKMPKMAFWPSLAAKIFSLYRAKKSDRISEKVSSLLSLVVGGGVNCIGAAAGCRGWAAGGLVGFRALHHKSGQLLPLLLLHCLPAVPSDHC